MTQYDERPGPSGWAIGGVTFAGVMMILIGTFQAIAGLVAIIDDSFYVVGQNYTFDIDTTAWGWIHLLLGILVFLAGIYLFRRCDLGGRDCDCARRDQRDRELLLHPVLPVLVAADDRDGHLGDLVTDPARGGAHDVTTREGSWRLAKESKGKSISTSAT